MLTSRDCLPAGYPVRKKRTEITFEVDEVIYAGGHRNPDASGLTLAWCLECRSEALMVTPQEAAAIAQVTVRAVNQRVESGTVHFLETTLGQLLVCVNSLSEPRAATAKLPLIQTTE